MKLTDRRFWIAWGVLLVIVAGVCIYEGWCEDTALLGGAYALSLLSVWLYYRVRPRVAYGNLIVMIVYNAILAFNLAFYSQYGSGLTWWFLILLLNAIHSVAILIILIVRYLSTLNRL